MNLPDKKPEVVVVVEIPPQFESFASAALLKVQAQFPSHRFAWSGSQISVSDCLDVEMGQLRKAVLHALYREKIYVETLSMRQALISAVTSS